MECFRLLLHINGNIKCAEKFSILGLQIEYSRYQYDKMPRKNMRQQKYADPQGFNDDLNLRVGEHEARKKAQNLSKVL